MTRHWFKNSAISISILDSGFRTIHRTKPNTSIALAFFALAFQDSYDGDYGVLIPCRCWRAEEFVDLAKIADGFHVAAMRSEAERLMR